MLIYLRDTTESGIQFTESDLKLSAYSDTDWIGDLDSRRSTTCYVVYATAEKANCMAIEITIDGCCIYHGSRIHSCIRCYTRVDLDQGGCWVK